MNTNKAKGKDGPVPPQRPDYCVVAKGKEYAMIMKDARLMQEGDAEFARAASIISQVVGDMVYYGRRKKAAIPNMLQEFVQGALGFPEYCGDCRKKETCRSRIKSVLEY